MSKVQGPQYYDHIYSNSAMYNSHYTKSHYWNLYQNIFSLIPKVVHHIPPKILDVGCGTGQFGQYLYDKGLTNYLGIDFSEAAIEIAKRNSAQQFIRSSYEDFSFESFNVIIALEVLEHLKNDLEVVEKLPDKALFIFSLPSYSGEAHVRHFKNKDEILSRYSKIFDIRILRPLKLENGAELFYGRGYSKKEKHD